MRLESRRQELRDLIKQAREGSHPAIYKIAGDVAREIGKNVAAFVLYSYAATLSQGSPIGMEYHNLASELAFEKGLKIPEHEEFHEQYRDSFLGPSRPEDLIERKVGESLRKRLERVA